jgi:3-phosphoshikimate 1-carboxyvinyltransferase
VDLTIGTMRAFGVEAERDDDYRVFRMRGSQSYEPADFAVEGDWSGAAFLLAAAAIGAKGEGLSVAGLDPLSCQPDRAILEALKLCGAGLEVSGAEIRVRRQSLKAFSFDATDCPDLFPPLVALATACDGRTDLRGANRLRGKESDRAAALSEEFGALGAVVEVDGDVMTVEGCGLDRGGLLQGGKADSRGDHRMAMAAAIASLASRASVEIEGADCVAKSWPSFFEDFAAIAH